MCNRFSSFFVVSLSGLMYIFCMFCVQIEEKVVDSTTEKGDNEEAIKTEKTTGEDDSSIPKRGAALFGELEGDDDEVMSCVLEMITTLVYSVLLI